MFHIDDDERDTTQKMHWIESFRQIVDRLRNNNLVHLLHWDVWIVLLPRQIEIIEIFFK
jgi:hypothetical protein